VIRRVKLKTPWFAATVTVEDFEFGSEHVALIKSVESCSVEPLVGWALPNVQAELERASVATAYGERGVTLEELPAEKVA
jgi:hypothetical protein